MPDSEITFQVCESPEGGYEAHALGYSIALNRRAILAEPSIVDNNVMGVHPSLEALHPRLLFYFMWTVRLGDTSRATTVPSVRKSDVENLPIPPPTPLRTTPHRRRNREALHPPRRLGSRPQARPSQPQTLPRQPPQAACEGRLVPTEAELARSEHRDYEPADRLLERILADRRTCWEPQPKRRGKYKEPAPPETSDLPDLPEGWVWSTVGSCLSSIQAGKSFTAEARPPAEQEFGVVKVSSVTWGVFDESESKTCHDPIRVEPSLLISEGDFLFSRANTIQLVGACVIAGPVNRKLMLSDKILRFTIVGVPKAWLLHYLKSVYGRRETERLATGNQESMRNIGQDRIHQIRLPLPLPICPVVSYTISFSTVSLSLLLSLLLSASRRARNVANWGPFCAIPKGFLA